MWTNYFLTRVETSSPETFTTPFGLWFRRKLHPILRPVLRLASGCRIHVERYPKLVRACRTSSRQPTSCESLFCRKEDKEHDLVKYMRENWKK